MCRYNLDNTPVAVKIPNSNEYNEFQKHEILLLKKANPHANIIRFIGQVEVSSKIWILMELMRGSVRDLLNQNPLLSSNTKLSIAIQMATGVAYLHKLHVGHLTRKAIVHQDLKPDNLLVSKLDDDPNLIVKISDFGIARQVDEFRLPIIGKISSKFHRGQVGGTLIYTAPEIVAAMALQQDCCEPKSDVFSVGLILWEIATTQQPKRSLREIEQGMFQEFTDDKNCRRKRMANISFFRDTFGASTEPTYPKSSFFGPVIKKCIRPNVDDRFSARKTLEILQQISL